MSTCEPWVSWDVLRPTDSSISYWWRLKSDVIPELTLIFAARLLPCDEFQKIPVPQFSYWDKWQFVVPPCEWKPAPDIKVNKYSIEHLSVEGLEFLPCPFCRKIPRLRAWRRAHDGGIVMRDDPQKYNCWHLKCCDWGSTPSIDDPRKIEQIRRAAFARAARELEDSASKCAANGLLSS